MKQQLTLSVCRSLASYVGELIKEECSICTIVEVNPDGTERVLDNEVCPIPSLSSHSRFKTAYFRVNCQLWLFNDNVLLVLLTDEGVCIVCHRRHVQHVAAHTSSHFHIALQDFPFKYQFRAKQLGLVNQGWHFLFKRADPDTSYDAKRKNIGRF